jgi:ABC-type lipoprotein release transport system permease subunit
MRPRRGGRRLRHARWQSLLAVAAIAAAVSLPVVLVSVGGGVAAHELADLENTGYQIVVSAAGLHGIEYAHEDEARILALPGVVNAAPILSVAIDVFNGSGKVAPVLAEGVVPDQFEPTLGPTERGFFPSPLPLNDRGDTLHYANGTYTGVAPFDVLLSSTYAAEAGVSVGDRVILSPTVNASLGVGYNVTGLFGTPLSLVQPSGAFAALVLLSNLQTLTGFATGLHTVVPDGADTIEVVVAPSVADDPGQLATVAGEVHRVLPSYTVTILSSEASDLRSAEGVLTGFYLALSSVGLVVGLLFLGLVLVRRVERERRSIGIRRAIGLSASSVGAQIVANGALLAAVGGAAGLVGGYAIVRALATWAGSSTVREAAQLAVFGPGFLAELVAAVVALSVVASASAVRAAWRVDLLEALR